MLGYWPYATHKKQFLYFLCQKTQTSHLIIVKVNKPRVSQILKVLINQLLNPKKYIETCSTFSQEIQHGFICPQDI
jgi:hypothetical protein